MRTISSLASEKLPDWKMDNDVCSSNLDFCNVKQKNPTFQYRNHKFVFILEKLNFKIYDHISIYFKIELR